MKKYILSLLTVILSLISSIYANHNHDIDIGVNLNDNSDFELGLIVDSKREYDIEKVAKIKEYETVSSRYNIIDSRPTYWFVLRLRNTSPQRIEKLVGINEAFVEVVNFYTLNDTLWDIDVNGLSIPVKNRSFISRLPFTKVLIEPYETKTIYIEVNSEFIGAIEICLINEGKYAYTEQLKTMVYWGYWGVAVTILLFSLFFLIFLKERVYLYYFFNVISLIVFAILYSGYSQYFNISTELYYKLHVSSPLIGVFITLFTLEFLNVKNLSKWLYYLLFIIVGGYIVLCILILFDLSFYNWMLIYVFPTMTFLLFIGIFALIKKTKLSSYYVLAMSIYIIGLILLTALTLNVLPNIFITRYGFLFGSMFEILIFSLALAYKVRIVHNEKEQIQAELLNKEQTVKVDLEFQVKNRTKELNESNKTKDKFFSIIAHDLKSPLSSVLGLLEILDNDYESFLENKRREMINVLYNSAKNMYSLLENLLIWSRIQIDKIEYKPDKINVKELVSSNVELFSQLASQKQIEININIQGVKYITSDKNMLNTILRNLISNGIKFTDKNGFIEIVIKNKIINEKNYVEFIVADTGVGISPERIEKLFVVSDDMSTLGTSHEKGTGLGLILCKDFLEKMGGEIFFQNNSTRGSRFSFILPL